MKKKRIKGYYDSTGKWKEGQSKQEMIKKFEKKIGHKLRINPHPKVHSRKYWQNQIKKNPNKVITIIINYEKIIVKIIKMKMLGWGYRPPLEHSPIKLSKGKIKFKTRRKKMTKAEKKKFLARLNKGRKKAGLKPIRAKR